MKALIAVPVGLMFAGLGIPAFAEIPRSEATTTVAPSAHDANLASRTKPRKGTLSVTIANTGTYTVIGKRFRVTASGSRYFKVRPGLYSIYAKSGQASRGKVRVKRGRTTSVRITFPSNNGGPATTPPGTGPTTRPQQPPLRFGSTLAAGKTLPAGYALTSPNGRLSAAMQGDGNFVVYEGKTVRWSSGTAGSGANRLVMQGDGNLVLYAGNAAKWSSNTAGTGTTRLVLQDDANLVLYENDRATWSWRDGYLGGDLWAGNTLRPGVTLWSPNHRYGAVMQGDGNFVVYDGGTAKWSTGTTGTGANRLVMQGDGNLVVYAGDTPKWSSNTAGTGTARLVIQNDGNLVLYEKDRATWSWRDGYLGGDLWAGNTLRPGVTLWSPNHRYGAVMQGDGNFVVYDGGTAKWSTGTTGTGANRLVMQGDGNLVVYAGDTPEWSSNTAGTGTNRLVMQDDGNLVLYSPNGAAWSIYSSAGKVDAFVSKYLGKSIDKDGWYGAQCVDLYFVYNLEVAGGPYQTVPGNGYAYNLWTNPTAAMLNTYMKIPAGQAARKGDVAVWSSSLPGSDGAGHVAIVLADSGGSLTVLQQNYGGRRYVTQDSVSKSHLLGYLRPKAL